MFFETIKIQNSKIYNLNYHQRRFEKTIFDIFRIKTDIILNNLIDPNYTAITRCKVHYSNQVDNIEYIPYSKKVITSLKIVESDIKYEYKYENRENINKLIDNKYSDIIILKNGYVTDTSIANIALKIDNTWYTPKEALFYGVTRQRFLNEKIIYERELTEKDIRKANKIAFLNAMIGLDEYDIRQIKID